MNEDLFSAKDDLERCSARFSPCRQYRYELWRRWGRTPQNPYVMFIGLNPSTADETTDDPTIRKCVGFAKRWGFGSLCMTNLFAWRATDPKEMKVQTFPVGEDNDRTLAQIAKGARLVIACWGNYGNHMGRRHDVLRLLPLAYCLGINSTGEPKHPLYLPYETQYRCMQDLMTKEE